jgi:Uma2 family endonuclease
MVAEAIQKQKTVITKQKPRPISWETFKKVYLEREDGFKYEWVDGYVEKTPRTMDKKQFFVIENLLALLDILRYEKKADGRLIPEGDNFFSGKHRRPDIAYYTYEQIRQTQNDEQNKVVPQFVIEVISSNDQMNRAVEKLKNYRAAEVPVVWHIYPNQNEIHIFRGKQMTICVGDDICSAEPVITGFKLSVNDVMKKL